MVKTDRMLLIEERAGKDVKDVLAEAFDATGTLQGMSAFIEERLGIKVAHNILAGWISGMGGTVRKTIEWDGFTPGELAAAPEPETAGVA